MPEAKTPLQQAVPADVLSLAGGGRPGDLSAATTATGKRDLIFPHPICRNRMNPLILILNIV